MDRHDAFIDDDEEAIENVDPNLEEYQSLQDYPELYYVVYNRNEEKS